MSEARAKEVKQYLVDKGIEANRLQANGFGQANPIAENETEEGRAQDRRVAFNILKQKPTGYTGSFK